MTDLLISRLKDRLSALELSARAASLRAGLGPDAIRSIFNGSSKSPRAETLAALADALECDVNYLLGNTDEPGKPTSEAPQARRTPLLSMRGELEAGSFKTPGAPYRAGAHPKLIFETEALASYKSAEQWLEVLHDDSVDLVFPRGSYIHCLDTEDQPPERFGWYVVERFISAGGTVLVERSIKQYDLDENDNPILCARSSYLDLNKVWPYDKSAKPQTLHIVAAVIRAIVVPPTYVPGSYTRIDLGEEVTNDTAGRYRSLSHARKAMLSAKFRLLSIPKPRTIDEFIDAVAQLPSENLSNPTTSFDEILDLVQYADSGLRIRKHLGDVPEDAERLRVAIRDAGGDPRAVDILARIPPRDRPA